jgi:2-succinyl-5-enolpyruvyl-6-hydroxy-3-cyclohexene-1-carboxylate synthase
MTRRLNVIGHSGGAGDGAERRDGGDPGDAGPSWAVVQTAWARVFMDALVRSGLTDVVVSPGSRSTPLVMAAAYVGLRLHPMIDERAAGFFALGMAKATGAPVALLCTSGTAAAHYYPAVIEADADRAPLVVITADRPPALHGCAANQTIDQAHLYGSRTRKFVDLGVADADRAALRALRRKAAQAMWAARAPIPGPVHVNAPAKKPLEPAVAAAAADIAIEHRADAVMAESLPRPIASPPSAPPAVLASLAEACRGARRGLLAFGPHPPHGARALREAALRLARITGFPVLAEASSQVRFAGAQTPASLCDGFDTLLSSPQFRAGASPDLIVQVGRPLTSAAWSRYVTENAECVRCVIDPGWPAGGWADPESVADMLVLSAPTAALVALADAIEGRACELDPAWAARFSAGNALVWQRVDAALNAADPGANDSDDDGDVLGDGAPAAPRDRGMREGQAMRAIAAGMAGSPGALLCLGSSLPVRDADTYLRGDALRADVLTQRGASGIDGLIAGAAGAAAAREPVALVLGDVSFRHDVGGLAAARAAERPLAIVVLDNAGGRIFEQLPIADAADPALLDALWLTDAPIDYAAAAATYGLDFVRAADPDALRDAVGGALAGAGATVIHALIAPSSAAVDRAALVAGIDARIAEEIPPQPPLGDM